MRGTGGHNGESMGEPGKAGGWSWGVILLLIVVNVGGGMVLRMLITGQGAGGAGAPAAARARPQGNASIWARLLGALKPKGEGLRDELHKLYLMWSAKDEQRPLPAGPRRDVDYHPKPLPDEPGERPAQKAARLWQGGVLATRQGDYPWAIRQFKSCLEADPGSEGCRAGLAEAQRRLEWNKRTGKVK